MKGCRDKEIQLKNLIKGTLVREEAESFKSHLLKCKACRHVLRRENPLLIFSLLSEQTKAKHFWQNYWETIRCRISTKKTWFEWMGFVRPLPAAAVLSSLVIVTFLFLFVIVKQGSVGPPPVVEIVPAEGEIAEETVLNRLQVYQEKTKPLKAYFQKEGKLKIFQADGSIAEIQNDIRMFLDSEDK